MKIKNKIIISLAIIVGMLLFTSNVKAAMEINTLEEYYVSRMNVDDAFISCYNLRLPSSTLGNNNLDPHLILNKDWGAVEYLMLSNYGVRMIGGKAISVTLNGRSYNCWTTTGNASGVSGNTKNYTSSTASLVDKNPEESSTTYLKNNLNTRYVELIELDSQERPIGVGCGFEEVRPFSTYYYGQGTWRNATVDYIPIWQGIKDIGSTQSTNAVMVRPVIWNN